jgi:antitoxin MazE
MLMVAASGTAVVVEGRGFLTAPMRRRILIVDTREVLMRTRVQKWGNSLALRIPKSFAAEIGLAENLAVDMSVTEGRLVVQRPSEEPLCLAELLRGVTSENLHGEWEMGPAVGKEVW